MKTSETRTRSCSCTSCFYKSESERPSLRRIILEGSRIDKLYLGKFIPLRERNLLKKLLNTRAAYNSVNEYETSSDYSFFEKTTNKIKTPDNTIHYEADEIRKNETILEHTRPKNASERCSCCTCSSDTYPHKGDRPQQRRRYRRWRRKQHETRTIRRPLHPKAKPIQSAPCTCKFNNSIFICPSNHMMSRSVSRAVREFASKFGLNRHCRSELQKAYENVRCVVSSADDKYKDSKDFQENLTGQAYTEDDTHKDLQKHESQEIKNLHQKNSVHALKRCFCIFKLRSKATITKAKNHGTGQLKKDQSSASGDLIPQAKISIRNVFSKNMINKSKTKIIQYPPLKQIDNKPVQAKLKSPQRKSVKSDMSKNHNISTKRSQTEISHQLITTKKSSVFNSEQLLHLPESSDFNIEDNRKKEIQNRELSIEKSQKENEKRDLGTGDNIRWRKERKNRSIGEKHLKENNKTEHDKHNDHRQVEKKDRGIGNKRLKDSPRCICHFGRTDRIIVDKSHERKNKDRSIQEKRQDEILQFFEQPDNIKDIRQKDNKTKEGVIYLPKFFVKKVNARYSKHKELVDNDKVIKYKSSKFSFTNGKSKTNSTTYGLRRCYCTLKLGKSSKKRVKPRVSLIFRNLLKQSPPVSSNALTTGQFEKKYFSTDDDIFFISKGSSTPIQFEHKPKLRIDSDELKMNTQLKQSMYGPGDTFFQHKMQELNKKDRRKVIRLPEDKREHLNREVAKIHSKSANSRSKSSSTNSIKRFSQITVADHRKSASDNLRPMLPLLKSTLKRCFCKFYNYSKEQKRKYTDKPSTINTTSTISASTSYNRKNSSTNTSKINKTHKVESTWHKTTITNENRNIQKHRNNRGASREVINMRSESSMAIIKKKSLGTKFDNRKTKQRKTLTKQHRQKKYPTPPYKYEVLGALLKSKKKALRKSYKEHASREPCSICKAPISCCSLSFSCSSNLEICISNNRMSKLQMQETLILNKTKETDKNPWLTNVVSKSSRIRMSSKIGRSQLRLTRNKKKEKAPKIYTVNRLHIENNSSPHCETLSKCNIFMSDSIDKPHKLYPDINDKKLCSKRQLIKYLTSSVLRKESDQKASNSIAYDVSLTPRRIPEKYEKINEYRINEDIISHMKSEVNNAHIFNAKLFMDSNKPYSRHFYAMNVHVAKRKLMPFECEPGVCVPNECNPHECLKLINQRLKCIESVRDTLKLTTSTSYEKPQTKGRGHQSAFQQDMHMQTDTSKVIKNAKTDTSKIIKKVKKSDKQRKEEWEGYTKKKAVKIGSNVNFNLELAKGNDSRTGAKVLPKSKSSIKKTPRRYDRKLEMNDEDGYHKNKKHLLNKFSRKQNTEHKPTLEPHECEPNTCIPGECDPYKCLERMKKRNNHRESRSDNRQTKSSGAIRHPIIHRPTRQAVAIGSTFSFQIEFFKEKNPHYKSIQAAATALKQAQTKRRKYKQRTKGTSTTDKTHEKSFASVSMSSHVSQTPRTSALKRCFCTLKLHADGLISDENITKVRDYGTKAKRLPKIKPSLIEQGVDTCPNKICPSLHERGVMTHENTRTKSSNCEPSICVPNNCDPDICYNIIRNKLHKTVSTATRKYKSKSEYTSKTEDQVDVVIEDKMSRKREKMKRKHMEPEQNLKERKARKERRKRKIELADKQGVRLGSSFRFNVEFTKNEKKLHRGEEPRIIPGSRTAKILKRCFCTIPLQMENKEHVKPSLLHRYESKKMDHSSPYNKNFLNYCNPSQYIERIIKQRHLKKRKVPSKTIHTSGTFDTKSSKELQKQLFIINDKPVINYTNISGPRITTRSYYQSKQRRIPVSDNSSSEPSIYFHNALGNDSIIFCKSPERVIFNRSTESVTLLERMRSSLTGVGPNLKQCFCAMRLDTTHKSPFDGHYKNYKLEPYECEPGVCDPDNCNADECFKRVMERHEKEKRNRPKRSVKTSTDYRRKKSAGTYTPIHFRDIDKESVTKSKKMKSKKTYTKTRKSSSYIVQERKFKKKNPIKKINVTSSIRIDVEVIRKYDNIRMYEKDNLHKKDYERDNKRSDRREDYNDYGTEPFKKELNGAYTEGKSFGEQQSQFQGPPMELQISSTGLTDWQKQTSEMPQKQRIVQNASQNVKGTVADVGVMTKNKGYECNIGCDPKKSIRHFRNAATNAIISKKSASTLTTTRTANKKHQTIKNSRDQQSGTERDQQSGTERWGPAKVDHSSRPVSGRQRSRSIRPPSWCQSRNKNRIPCTVSQCTDPRCPYRKDIKLQYDVKRESVAINTNIIKRCFCSLKRYNEMKASYVVNFMTQQTTPNIFKAKNNLIPEPSPLESCGKKSKPTKGTKQEKTKMSDFFSRQTRKDNKSKETKKKPHISHSSLDKANSRQKNRGRETNGDKTNTNKFSNVCSHDREILVVRVPKNNNQNESKAISNEMQTLYPYKAKKYHNKRNRTILFPRQNKGITRGSRCDINKKNNDTTCETKSNKHSYISKSTFQCFVNIFKQLRASFNRTQIKENKKSKNSIKCINNECKVYSLPPKQELRHLRKKQKIKVNQMRIEHERKYINSDPFSNKLKRVETKRNRMEKKLNKIHTSLQLKESKKRSCDTMATINVQKKTDKINSKIQNDGIFCENKQLSPYFNERIVNVALMNNLPTRRIPKSNYTQSYSIFHTAGKNFIGRGGIQIQNMALVSKTGPNKKKEIDKKLKRKNIQNRTHSRKYSLTGENDDEYCEPLDKVEYSKLRKNKKIKENGAVHNKIKKNGAVPRIADKEKEDLFELKLDSGTMSLLNRDEVHDRVLVAHTRNLSAPIPMGHDPNTCECCICKGQRRRKIKTRKIDPERPCICGSVECKYMSKQLEPTRKKEVRKLMLHELPPPCICGSRICYKEQVRLALGRGPVSKSDKKRIRRMYAEGPLYKKMEAIRKQKAELQKEAYRKRQRMYENTDRERRKEIMKEQKTLDRKLKRYRIGEKSDVMLVGDTVVDFGRVAKYTSVGLLRRLFRAIIHPTDILRTNKSEIPKEIATAINDTTAIPTFKRAGTRFKKMNTTNMAYDLLGNLHVVPPRKKTRKKYRKEDNLCPIGKKPLNFIYERFPYWFYLIILSLVRALKSVGNILMIVLAVILWCPAFMCMEIMRSILCSGCVNVVRVC